MQAIYITDILYHINTQNATHKKQKGKIMKKKTRQLIIGAVVLLTVFCLAFIFGNSLKDSAESSEQSSAVKELLMSVARLFGFRGDINVSRLRNFAHVAEFSLLGACLGTLALYFARRRAVTLARYMLFVSAALGAGILVAVFDELLQLTSVGRVCDIKDVMLDTIGIFFGMLVSAFVYFLIIKIRKMRMTKEKDKN